MKKDILERGKSSTSCRLLIKDIKKHEFRKSLYSFLYLTEGITSCLCKINAIMAVYYLLRGKYNSVPLTLLLVIVDLLFARLFTNRANDARLYIGEINVDIKDLEDEIIEVSEHNKERKGK